MTLTTLVLVVGPGVVAACLIAFHFGCIVGAERVRDGARAVQEGAAFPAAVGDHMELPALEEVTAIQCQGCRKALGACRCPKVLGREGSC